MRHAGVAVSVTTFTDVIAFFVGTNTLLPGLQSFCVYAAVSIFTIYALQVTHFVAWFSLGKSERERGLLLEISKLFSNILFHLACWLAGWILSYIVCFCPILKLIFF